MLSDLPCEILLNILSYLDYKDLICCSQLNRRLSDISNYDYPWKLQCMKYWLEQQCPPDRTWKEHFRHWYRDMGRYIHCYATIKSAWNKIIAYVEEYCPVIYQSMKSGVSEEELDDSEARLKTKFPDDLRCSFRIYNGQRLTSPGLMGSMSIHSHYRSESLLDLDTAVAGFQNRDGLHGCMPLTFCLHSALTQFIALSDADGYEPNTIFYPALDRNALQYHISDAFISGRSYTEWLTTYANQLHNHEFVIIHDQPFRFLKDPTCQLRTNYISVSVATCFLPELSNINPPHFFHTYRITMTMDEDSPKSETCQLETRHWIITNENGEEERVDGPGVVGEYPIMFPGATFSWVSCTSFNTTYGNMRGNFKMRNLLSGMNCAILLLLVAAVSAGAYELSESESEVVYRVTRGAKGNRNRGECRYRKGEWEECNPTTNLQQRTLTLKKGDPSCEKTKQITRKCKKACRYDNGEWSECDPSTKTRTRTDALKAGSDPSCEAERTVTKKCKKVCRYDRRAEWSPCDQVSGQKTKTMRLQGGQPAECEATKVVSRPCRGGRKSQPDDDYDDEEE